MTGRILISLYLCYFTRHADRWGQVWRRRRYRAPLRSSPSHSCNWSSLVPDFSLSQAFGPRDGLHMSPHHKRCASCNSCLLKSCSTSESDYQPIQRHIHRVGCAASVLLGREISDLWRRAIPTPNHMGPLLKF